MDSITELHQAVIGEAKLTEDKYSYWWKNWQELLDKGLLNDDIASITLGEAMDGWASKF
jgi:hypothetical protein